VNLFPHPPREIGQDPVLLLLLLSHEEADLVVVRDDLEGLEEEGQPGLD